MSNLAVFLFESQEVRFIDGKPVANDVAAVLGYTDPAKTISTKVFPQNKGVTKAVTPGGIQSVTVLEEAGIYQLIFSSKLKSAQKFQQWVFEEVLPSLRATGKYEIAPQPAISEEAKAQYDLIGFALDEIFKNVPIKPELVAGIKLNALKEIAPAIAPNALNEARQLLIVNTAQEHELLTVTQIGEHLGLSAQAVNKLLIQKGLQVKNDGRKSQKEPAYLPTAHGSEFADLTLATGSNNSSTFQQLRWYKSVLAAL